MVSRIFVLLLSLAGAASAAEIDACALPPDIRDLQLVARAGQAGHLDMDTVILRDKGARVIPDAMEQSFDLDDAADPLLARLGAFALGTFMFAESPSSLVQAGADQVTTAEASRRVSRAFDLRKLDWSQISTIKDDTGALHTRLRVYVPAIRPDWLTFSPIRRTTFAVIGCPHDPSSRSVRFLLERDVSSRPYCLLLTAALTAGVYALLALSLAGTRLGWRRFDPVMITQDAMGYGSTTRMQVLFFTFIIGATLTYIFLRAGYLTEINGNLLLLLGIIGAGSTLSKLVGNARASFDDDVTFTTGRWLTRHGIVFPPRTPRWRDLVTNGREFDVYKFQGLVFSGLVGAWILSSGMNGLADLRIPDNITYLLGLSQAVYVGGKAVAGPSRKGLNNAVHRAIAAEAALLALVPADHPYRMIARARGLALSAGATPPPVPELPEGARLAYAEFAVAAGAVMGLAIELLGPTPAASPIEPVDPPDDTAAAEPTPLPA